VNNVSLNTTFHFGV